MVDATAMPPDRGGVGRYLEAVLPELAELPDLDVTIVVQPRDLEPVGRLVTAARVVPAPALTARRPLRLLWEQVGLPLRAARADVLLCPHYTMPQLGAVPRVVTLHDATFFSHPALHSRLKAVFFRTATRLAVRRAARLVVPSRATQREVERFAGARSDMFVVALHGVDPTVFHPVTQEEKDRVRRSLGIEGRRYVAFLGTLEPRKNVPALVRAWVAAVEGSEDPPALVLAGARGWDSEVDAAVAAVPPRLTVVRPGYVPLEDLAGLLGGADVVAYPSLGEGFGLPVLEAMACGAPVLTSRELSLSEVGGDAVAYTGTSAAEIGEQLAALLVDPARRAALSVAALERAGAFTWRASAASHAAALRAAARQRPERSTAR